ncbi:MAG: CRTAC1 family protein [Nitrosomonas sp.]|nr:CRTAC1 family protein [Nitrosomonas sp.]
MHSKHCISKLLKLTSLVSLALSASQIIADSDIEHLTKHTDKSNAPFFTNRIDLLNPSYEIKGFSFMPGAAAIDFDNDGYEDIYLANGKGHPNALFRNIRGKGFKQIPSNTGLADEGQTTGIAVGDLNNDGYDDIYVGNGSTVGDGLDTNDGMDRIYISNGNGTFTDITASSGINEPGFTTSIAMADYDKDGFLDIFIGRFVDFDFFNPQANRTNPTKNARLYRNNGDLTFTDVTEKAGLKVDHSHNTWAAVWFDYDNDGSIDLFIGHEQGPIEVYRNLGNGRFENLTESSGDLKLVGAWMGLAVGDFDNDGDFDLFASNISDVWGTTRDPKLPALVIPPPETWDNPRNTLFINNGDGTFTDANKAVGLPDTIQFGWGTVSADFNNDGWLDFYLAQNFSVVGIIGRERDGAGPGALFVNKGDGTFTDHSYVSGTKNIDASGNYLDGRGVLKADFDNDGKIDIFLVNSPQYEELFPFGQTIIPGTSTPKLFMNASAKSNGLVLNLTGTGKSNRNAIGAIVEVFTHDGDYQKHTVVGGGSAFSSSSRKVHIGLGKNKNARIVVSWPDGAIQEFKNVRSGHWNVIQGHKKMKKH